MSEEIGRARAQVTQLLELAQAGDSRASEELLPLVYDELRRLARSQLKGEPNGGAGQTLQATALVHEAYMRLVGDANLRWDNRAYFFGAAARAMRRILVDRARLRGRQKRGGDRARVELSDCAADSPAGTGTDLVELDAALSRLEADEPRKAEVVMLRYFAGLSIEETASALGLSTATVKNEWMFARAWLKRELERAAGESGEGGSGP
jgi:RNA polymerase sigma factor (TIGR02999 family)